MLEKEAGLGSIEEQIVSLMNEQFNISLDLSDENVSIESQNNGKDFLLIKDSEIHHFYKLDNGELVFLKLNGVIVNWKIKDGKITLINQDGIEVISDVAIDNSGNIRTISSKDNEKIILQEEFKVNDTVSLFKTKKGYDTYNYIRTINGEYKPFYINDKEVFFDVKDESVKLLTRKFKGHIDFDENGEIITQNINGKRCIKNEKKLQDGEKSLYTMFDIDNGEELMGKNNEPELFLLVNGNYVIPEEGIEKFFYFTMGSNTKIDIVYRGNNIFNPKLSNNGKLIRGKYNETNVIISENKNIDIWSNGGYHPGEYTIDKLYDESNGEYLGLKILINGEYFDIKSEGKTIDPLKSSINFLYNKINQDGEIELYNYNGNKYKIVETQRSGEDILYNIQSLDGKSIDGYKILSNGSFYDITLKGEIANLSSYGAASVKLNQTNGNEIYNPKINDKGEIVIHKFSGTEYVEQSTHRKYKSLNIASFIPLYGQLKSNIYKIHDNGVFRDVTLNGEKLDFGFEGNTFYVMINGIKYNGVELNSDASIITSDNFGDEVFFHSKYKWSKSERELIDIKTGKIKGYGVTINGKCSNLNFDGNIVKTRVNWRGDNLKLSEILVEIPGNVIGDNIVNNIQVGENGEIKYHEIKLDTSNGAKKYLVIANGYFLKLGNQLHRLDSSSDIITKLATIVTQIEANNVIEVNRG